MDQSLHNSDDSFQTVDECENETQRLQAVQPSHENVRYLTLVVKDEKVFMVHRDVLLKASPIFVKLLKSGTKGEGEGTIRLEMLTAPLMEIILKFIYNDRCQINTEEDAKNVIIAADQLFLLRLKDIAVRFLQQKLSTSNCITTYYFAKGRHCEELTETSKTFIHLNFAKVAQSKDFLDLSSQEIEKWISSDDVVINAEVDIFNIIIRWIESNKIERMKTFEELFRHVRLIFISRDYLTQSMAKNILVKRNADCLDRVNQAIKWLDRGTDFDVPWQHSPRKMFESHVIVAYQQKKVLCYSPDQDRWLNLPDINSEPVHLVTRQGKLYAFSSYLDKCQRYEPLFNDWVPFPRSESSVKPITATNHFKGNTAQVLVVQGEIYAVENRSNAVLWKYSFNTSSWSSIAAFDWGDKDQVCVVAANKFLYAIGGRRWGNASEDYNPKCYFLSDAQRFNMEENAWENMEDIQEARRLAFGTACAGDGIYCWWNWIDWRCFEDLRGL